ncbi:protein of unknown function [Pararobbsia alpina]
MVLALHSRRAIDFPENVLTISSAVIPKCDFMCANCTYIFILIGCTYIRSCSCRRWFL